MNMITAQAGIHKIEQINEQTYRIDESGIANCYLLLGDNAALLIDCGCGIGSIGQTVQELTSLPVTVAITHRHCDHDGGRNFFKEYYVNHKDKGLVYAILSSDFAIKTLLKGNKATGFTISKKPFHAVPVYFDDSKIFDLGGRFIRTKNIHGHTAGSVVFIDDKYHLMFTGDDVNPYLWMQLPGCTSLSGWLAGAKQVLTLADTYMAYCGHGAGLISKKDISGIIAAVQDLLAHKPDDAKGNIDYPDPKAEYHVLVSSNRIR